jgi:hypothetical protein
MYRMRICCDMCERAVINHKIFCCYDSFFIKAMLNDFENDELIDFITNTLELSYKTIIKILTRHYECQHDFCNDCLKFTDDWDYWPDYDESKEYKMLFLKTIIILYYFKCPKCID